MTPIDLPRLPLAIPRDAILRRLRRRSATETPADLMRRIDRLIQEAASLCEPHARLLYLPVATEQETVRLGNWEPLASASLAALLQESVSTAIMAASIGEPLAVAIRESMDHGDMTRSVVLDATGSEMAEALAHASWLHVRRDLARRGQTLTRRFSPGYGDVPLSVNRTIHAALALAQWGVAVTERGLFVPEKTTVNLSGVIAASGAKDAEDDPS